MSDCEMPSKFLFEGEFDEVDVSLAVSVGVDNFFLLDKTTPTGITIAKMTIKTMPMMPGKVVSKSSHPFPKITYQSSSASASALHPLLIQHCQHRLSVVLSDPREQPSHHKARHHARGKSR